MADPFTSASSRSERGRGRNDPVAVVGSDLARLVARLFVAAGLTEAAAARVAEGLVAADLEGLSSHGVMLAENYLRRLRAGSISTREAAELVSDRGAAVVLDACCALGQLTGEQAIGIAVQRARRYGAGVAAVRHGFHFGAARRYALLAAESGCIGIALCNTRPLMPAPGGAERVVGNNPIAIALPTAGAIPLVLDMATSEAAMGKIRLAEKAGRPIPDGWAVSEDGAPTTVAAEAIKGMLLPVGGPKGFGLAFMIDLMCGLLAGGGYGAAVTPFYGDPSVAYDCSHLFIAIDVGHFSDLPTFRAEAEAAAERVRSGKRAPGIDRIYAPGEPEWRRKEGASGVVALEPRVAQGLVGLATEWRVSAEPLAELVEGSKGRERDAET